jgi:hypothetical protein
VERTNQAGAGPELELGVRDLEPPPIQGHVSKCLEQSSHLDHIWGMELTAEIGIVPEPTLLKSYHAILG